MEQCIQLVLKWDIGIYPTPQPEEKPKPTNPSSGDVNSRIYVIPGAPTNFKNCTELRVYYPKDVKKGALAD